MNIMLKMSNDKARTLKWLLGLRYGKQKKLETLLGMAIWDIANNEARNVLNGKYENEVKSIAKNPESKRMMDSIL